MNNTKPNKNFYLILILGMLSAIGPFSIDMYLPAFPDIAKGLNTEVSKVMLSLSSFFIGISVGQLIYGPMLERFGRKKPLYFGLSVYILASIGCSFSHDINMLIVWRCIQAISASSAIAACVGHCLKRFRFKQRLQFWRR